MRVGKGCGWGCERDRGVEVGRRITNIPKSVTKI